MIALTCLLGKTKATLDVPELVAHGRTLTDYFAAGSSYGGVQADIQLDVDRSTLAQDLKAPGDGVEAYHLHHSLRQLTGNPIDPSQRISRIAVIFADYYIPRPTIFGVMFDRGFATWDDPNSSQVYTGVPREGCAVFLDTIRQARNEAEYLNEVVYTTVHELGHVFNLDHLANPATFMASSDVDHAYTSAAFNFEPQKPHLSQCSVSPFVWPGGTAFGNTGDLGGFDVSKPAQKWTKTSTTNLRLRIRLSTAEAFSFEPVELEIELALASAKGPARAIPDVIDPGYSQCSIWIRQSNGEVRKYRPTSYYCPHKGKLVIRPGKPFRRDISIFGQSGGYTFTRAGHHQVWVALDFGATRLESNKADIHVKPRLNLKLREETMMKLLTDARTARAFYHKNARMRGREMENLATLANRFKQTSTGAAAHYVAGRIYQKYSRRLASPSARKTAQEKSRNHLQRALDHDLTSLHRQGQAAAMLESMI